MQNFMQLSLFPSMYPALFVQRRDAAFSYCRAKARFTYPLPYSPTLQGHTDIFTPKEQFTVTNQQLKTNL